MKSFITSWPAQIHIKVAKTGSIKRSYHFLSGDDMVAELNYSKSYSHNANAIIHGAEFEIMRRGLWKQYLEIRSTSNEQFNMKIDLSWRGSMRSCMQIEVNSFLSRQVCGKENGDGSTIEASNCWLKCDQKIFSGRTAELLRSKILQ